MSMPPEGPATKRLRRGLRRLAGRAPSVTVVTPSAVHVRGLERQSHPDVRVVVEADRNAGAAAADGDYLMFLDGSGRLTDSAIADLVGLLETSGSDFAVGT